MDFFSKHLKSSDSVKRSKVGVCQARLRGAKGGSKMVDFEGPAGPKSGISRGARPGRDRKFPPARGQKCPKMHFWYIAKIRYSETPSNSEKGATSVPTGRVIKYPRKCTSGRGFFPPGKSPAPGAPEWGSQDHLLTLPEWGSQDPQIGNFSG